MGVERRWWAVAAIALALTVTACSGRGDERAASVVSVAPAETATTVGAVTTLDKGSSTTEAPSTTSAPGTTSTTTPSAPTDEEQIVAVVEAYWQAVAEALDPPDPEYDWTRVATPSSAEARQLAMVENLEANRGIGQVEPGRSFVLAAEVALLAEDRALAFVCIRDNAFAYELDTGEVTETVSVIAIKRTELHRVDDEWRVHLTEPLQNYEPEQEAECESALPSF